jgi:membrane protease YdiL (CAAX protease family)
MPDVAPAAAWTTALGGARDSADWRGVLRPGRLLWLRAIAWGLALVVVVALTALPFRLVGLLVGAPEGSAVRLALFMATLAAMLGVYALAVRLGERRFADELAVAQLAPELAGGVAVGGVVFALVMAVLLGFGWYGATVQPAGAPWRALMIGLGAGVIEELVFRGILMRLLWEAFGLRVGLALSAVIFGLIHVVNPGHAIMGPVFIVCEAGLLLGGLYALTGRLWASIGAHAGWNFTQGYVFGTAVSGTDAGGHWLVSVATPGLPAVLTGGAFGPEASLGCLVVGTAAGVGVLMLTWRRRQGAGWGVR